MGIQAIIIGLTFIISVYPSQYAIASTLASTHVLAGSNLNLPGDPGPLIKDNTDASSSSVTVNYGFALYDDLHFSANAYAYASADYGVLKVFNSASAKGIGSSVSKANFSDDLLIDKSGLTGQTGFLTLSLKPTYSIKMTLGEYSSATGLYEVLLNSTYGYTFKLEVYKSCDFSSCTENNYASAAIGTNQTDYPISNEYILSLPFTFGTPFNFDIDITSLIMTSSAASSDNIGGGSIILDSSHSFYWGGINQLQDANGDPVSNFSISSASGTNYLQDFSVLALPEPDTYAMLLSGLGLVGFAARRRKFA